MRSVLNARRATLPGFPTTGFLIVLLAMLLPLHPTAAASMSESGDAAISTTPLHREANAPRSTQPKDWGKAKHHAAATPEARQSTSNVATAKPHSKHRGKTRHGAPGRTATKPAVARRRDPGRLVISEGDGSPVLSAAATYLGRPYRFGSEGHALDCSGFVRAVFADVGVDLPHSAREISTRGDRVRREALEPGDLVFFGNAGRPYATHIGIYVGDDKFVHAATRGGQVQIDLLTDTYYAQRYLCARRIET